jgi:hypothetical protein
MSGVIMRSVHQAVLAVAVTGVVAAVRHRSSTSKATMPRATARTTSRTTTGAPPRRRAVPAQRRSEIEELGLRVEELVVAEHDAQDARLFDALEWSAR